MSEDKYGKVAQEIRVLFEKKFGKYSFEDFNRVAKLLGVKVIEIKPDFDKVYENLSDNERKLVDFMMRL